MAYYTGIVNTISDVRQALINACTNEGWSWDSGNDVLYKGTLFLHLAVSATDLQATGRTSLLSGAMPRAVTMGKLVQITGQPTFEIVFPAAYHIFVFSNEVYLLVNYSTDRYQWLTFGGSTILNLPGTGMYVSGMTAGPNLYDPGPIDIRVTASSITFSIRGVCAIPFAWNAYAGFGHTRADYVHSGFEVDWVLALSDTLAPIGGKQMINYGTHSQTIGTVRLYCSPFAPIKRDPRIEFRWCLN